MKISFNLLPKKQKKYLHMQKVFRTIIEHEIQIIFVLLFLLLSLFAMYFILKTETVITNNVKKELTEQEQYKKIDEIHKNIANTHKEMKQIDKIFKNRILWSKLFEILSEKVPQTITVNSLNINEDTISMSALAQTRDDVVAFKEILKSISYNDEQCFEDIIVPESELTVPVDVVFTMTFKININCLK